MRIGFADVGRTCLSTMDYFKLLNRTALILLIVFAVWYYQPDNREVRGKDPCQYYTVKENVTCKCVSYKSGEIGTTKYFFPNGTYYQSKARTSSIVRAREFYFQGGGFNVTR